MYRNRKKQKVLMILMLICCLCLGGVRAISVRAAEHGRLQVKIREYQNDGPKESPWADNPVVLPGQQVSKIVRICNEGRPCFIRARVTVRENPEITRASIKDCPKGWKLKSDGYYYYTHSLKKEETITLFQRVVIPDALSQKWEDRSFFIDVCVEAKPANGKQMEGQTWKKQKIQTTSSVKTGDVSKTCILGIFLSMTGCVGMLFFSYVRCNKR